MTIGKLYMDEEKHVFFTSIPSHTIKNITNIYHYLIHNFYFVTGVKETSKKEQQLFVHVLDALVISVPFRQLTLLFWL